VRFNAEHKAMKFKKIRFTEDTDRIFEDKLQKRTTGQHTWLYRSLTLYWTAV